MYYLKNCYAFPFLLILRYAYFWKKRSKLVSVLSFHIFRDGTLIFLRGREKEYNEMFLVD